MHAGVSVNIFGSHFPPVMSWIPEIRMLALFMQIALLPCCQCFPERSLWLNAKSSCSVGLLLWDGQGGTFTQLSSFCGLLSGHWPECSAGIIAHPFSLRFVAVDLVCAPLFARGTGKMLGMVGSTSWVFKIFCFLGLLMHLKIFLNLGCTSTASNKQTALPEGPLLLCGFRECLFH